MIDIDLNDNRERCPVCDGDQVVACAACDGMGWRLVNSHPERPPHLVKRVCAHCQGRGYITCPRCHGSGEATHDPD